LRRTHLLFLAALGLLLGCGGPSAPASEPDQPAPPAAANAPAVAIGELLRAGLASSAMRLCSAVFVSGRTHAHVLAEELEGVAQSGMSFRIRENPQTVVASNAGMMATALHRPALGCTLVTPETSIDALLAQLDPAEYPETRRPDPELPWPEGTRVDLPEALRTIDLAAVHAAVDAAFADAAARTRGVVVVHHGRIIAERYAPPFDAATPQLGWSMTKTVAGALTGILIAQGMLDLDAPAPVAAWKNGADARSAITLDQLLRMSSGLAFSEVYDAQSASDVIRMLFTDGAYAMGAFAAAMPLDAEPGSAWSYASGTTNLIAMIHRETFEGLAAYLAFPRTHLFNPLGLSSAVLEPDASGVFVGSSYMYATPRDWARLGLLYLQDGVWQGTRILPEGWVAYSLTPAPAAMRGQYGAHIWLNRGAAENPADRPHPRLPDDMFYLSGFEGQNVVVVPSHDLVVVRMGLTRNGARPVWGLTEQVLAAIAADAN
jgi:CubicO group peptidase (beta-lactamase class C family)